MYLVRPDAAAPPFRVFCDQTTQNGGEEAWLLPRGVASRQTPLLVLTDILSS